MLTQDEVERMRREYSKIANIDPDGIVYKQLCKILDGTNDEGLLFLSRADIPWISKLALNRCIRRKLI